MPGASVTENQSWTAEPPPSPPDTLPSVYGAGGTGQQCTAASVPAAPRHALPGDLPEAPPGGVDPTQNQLEGHVNGNQHCLQNRYQESHSSSAEKALLLSTS